MANDLKHVRSGERFRYSATTHNAFVDAALAHRQGQHDQTAGTARSFNQTGIVLVKNNSGADRNRFDILGISTVLIAPTENEQQFQNSVALVGITPDIAIHVGKFAVLMEPLKAGAIGRACVSGVCPCHVRFMAANETIMRADITDADASALMPRLDGSAAILWAGEPSDDPYDDRSWCVVRLSNSPVGIFTVKVRKSGGVAGSDAGDCTWVYDLYRFADDPDVAAPIAEDVEPYRPRIPLTTYDFAEDDTYGLAMYDELGDVVLIEAIKEKPQYLDCED